MYSGWPLIQGNVIGAADDDASTEFNEGPGIIISGSSGNLIGGGEGDILSGRSPEGNVIGDNGVGEQFAPGIHLKNGAAFNRIQGNFIGFEPDGESPAPNGGVGIAIDTGANRNIIGRERANGVETGIGNRIGNNQKVEGNFAVSGNGIFIFGETAERNEVRGNILGSPLSTGPASNADHGIVVNGARFTIIDDNLINGNGTGGILIAATSAPEEGVNTVVTRNRIGLGDEGAFRSPFGILIAGSSHNLIGGVGPFDLRGTGVVHPDGNTIESAILGGVVIDGRDGGATENLVGGNVITDTRVGVIIDAAIENVMVGNRITANQVAGVQIGERAGRNLIGSTNQPNPNQPGHNVIAQNGVGVLVKEPDNIGILGNNFFGNGTDIWHDATVGVTPLPVVANLFTSTGFEFTSIEGQIVGNPNREHLLQFFLVNDNVSGPASFQFLGQRRFTPNADNGGNYRFVLGRAINPTLRIVATSSLVTRFAGEDVEQFNTSAFSAPANIQLFTDDGDGVPDAIEELLAPGTANDPALVTIPIFPTDNVVADVTELQSLKLSASSSGSSFREVEVLRTEVLGPLPPKVKVEAALQLVQVNIAGVGVFELTRDNRFGPGVKVRKLLLLNPPVLEDGTLNFEILVLRQDCWVEAKDGRVDRIPCGRKGQQEGQS